MLTLLVPKCAVHIQFSPKLTGADRLDSFSHDLQLLLNRFVHFFDIFTLNKQRTKRTNIIIDFCSF